MIMQFDQPSIMMYVIYWLLVACVWYVLYRLIYSILKRLQKKFNPRIKG